MDVYEAVESRRAVRAFRSDPVPREVLERVLQAASRAPSSGNLQPSRVFVVAGEPLARLTAAAVARAADGDPGDPREFAMYPDPMGPPYAERFAAAAAQRYAAFGVRREDPDRATRVATLNAGAFGAPAVLFWYLDPALGPAQWADAGAHLQTVLLLLRAEGLHSCPQVMWSVYRRTVTEAVGAEGLVLLWGVAVGQADERTPPVRTDRAPLEETVTWVGA